MVTSVLSECNIILFKLGGQRLTIILYKVRSVKRAFPGVSNVPSALSAYHEEKSTRLSTGIYIIYNYEKATHHTSCSIILRLIDSFSRT